MRILVTPEEYEELRDKEHPEDEQPKWVTINGVEAVWFTPKRSNEDSFDAFSFAVTQCKEKRIL